MISDLLVLRLSWPYAGLNTLEMQIPWIDIVAQRTRTKKGSLAMRAFVKLKHEEPSIIATH